MYAVIVRDAEGALQFDRAPGVGVDFGEVEDQLVMLEEDHRAPFL